MYHKHHSSDSISPPSEFVKVLWQYNQSVRVVLYICQVNTYMFITSTHLTCSMRHWTCQNCCNTPQQTVRHCNNTLQHTTPYRSTYTVSYPTYSCRQKTRPKRSFSCCTKPHQTAPHRTLPHHPILNCNTLQHTTPCWSTCTISNKDMPQASFQLLHHTAPHHTTPHHTTLHHTKLQHTAPHYTTPQHKYISYPSFSCPR